MKNSANKPFVVTIDDLYARYSVVRNNYLFATVYSMPALPQSIDNTEVGLGKTPVTGCKLVREWEAFTPCAAPNV
jgi:hypothetical protein